MEKRRYEISLWTHEDILLHVLGNSEIEFKGQITNPILTNNINGQIKFAFSIPLKYYDNTTQDFIENPLWYSKTDELRQLLNEQKIKVIYDKSTSTQEIFEFVVSKISEERKNLQLIMKVECESLAVYELSKIGKQLTLNEDILLLEEEETESTITPNINFWLDRVFPTGDKWSYSVDISNLNGDDDVIYEKTYNTSWVLDGDEYISGGQSSLIQKERFLQISNSNKYNITQDIAEAFQVFPQYIYKYENTNKPFFITGREVIYKIDNLTDSELEINYRSNLKSLSKTIESKNLITKMYVEPIESQYADDGYIAIANADANLNADNFILNFDYLYETGLLSYEKYSNVIVFETALRTKNLAIATNLNNYYDVDNTRIKKETELASLQDRRVAAQDVINDSNDKVATIDASLDTHILTQTKELVQVKSEDGTLYVEPIKQGAINDTVTIEEGTINTGFKILDEYGYILKIGVAGVSEDDYVHLTYTYDLFSYYNNQLTTYTDLLESLITQIETVNIILGDTTDSAAVDGEVYAKIKYYDAEYDTLISEKETLITAFDNDMGYYLKEGSWQSSDYSVSPVNNSDTIAALEDTNVLLGEFEPFYYSGVELTQVYYPYISLDGMFVDDIFDPEDLIITDTWTDIDGVEHVKTFLFDAHYKVCIKYHAVQSYPIVVLLDKNLTLTDHVFKIGDTNVNSAVTIAPTTAYTLNTKRILISDTNIISSSITVEHNDVLNTDTVSEFNDYNISRVDGGFYVTLKINNNVTYVDNTYDVTYKTNRAVTQFYLDAVDVMLNSSVPNVSYKVDVHDISSFTDKEHYTPSVGQIVRINDNELHFNGVKGLISSIQSNLDSPKDTKITIQNYKTKFEDLFKRMVAAGETIKTRGSSYERAATAITPLHQIDTSILQASLDENDIAFRTGIASNMSMDNDGLQIENTYPYANGVTGMVSIIGGGIFLSDSIDVETGNRIWHTGVTPKGINASLMTLGQLDVSKVNIYSGNQVRFTWNDEGLFAFAQTAGGDTDFTKWIKFNEEGLGFSRSVDVGGDPVYDLKLDWDGLTLGFQGDVVQLSSTDGLMIYKDDELRLQIGQFDVDAVTYYGMQLLDENGDITLRSTSDGNLLLSQTIQVGTDDNNAGLTGAGAEDESIRLWVGASYVGEEYDYTDSPFIVKQDGSLIASNAIITGSITATDGTFNGIIHANSGSIEEILTIGVNGYIGFYGGTIETDLEEEVVIWAGAPNENDVYDKTSAALQITGGGLLTANNVDITGNINVISGTLTELFIGEEYQAGLVYNDENTIVFWINGIEPVAPALFDPTTSKFYINKQGKIFSSSIELDENAWIYGNMYLGEQISGSYYNTGLIGQDSIFLDPITGANLRLWSGASDSNYNTADFRLYDDGMLYTNSLVLTGALEADSAALTGSLSVGDITIANAGGDTLGYIGSTNYISNVSGWRISADGSTEFSNATIRGELKAAVFEYEKINSIGGELYVSPAFIVQNNVLIINNELIIELANTNNSLWTTDAQVKIQAILQDTLSVITEEILDGIIINKNDTEGTITISLSTTEDYDSYYLLQNSMVVNAGQTGSCGIRLSAEDANGPFIDIFETQDTNSITRLGNLSGIVDSINGFGTLSGYGLYSDSVYLKGKLYLPNAGMTDDGDTDSDIRIWAGTNPDNKENAPFRITQGGDLYASSGTFSGSIHATEDSTFSGTLAIAGLIIDRDDDSGTGIDDNIPQKFYSAFQSDGEAADSNNPEVEGLSVKLSDLISVSDEDGFSLFHGGLRVFPNATSEIVGPDTVYTRDSFPYLSTVNSGKRMTVDNLHIMLYGDTLSQGMIITGESISFTKPTIKSASEDYLLFESSAYTQDVLSGINIANNGVYDYLRIHISNSGNNVIVFEDSEDTHSVKVGINIEEPTSALEVGGSITINKKEGSSLQVGLILGDVKVIEVGTKGADDYGIDIVI
jgi:hypothetical protein